MRAIALVVLAGCGRIGFDSLDGAAPLDVSSAPEQGLVAWWSFDEGSGIDAYDSSGNHLHAWTDACGFPYATWTTGRFGRALALSASKGNCASTDELPALELAGAWTVAAWVNPASLPPSGDAYGLVVKPNARSKHNYALFLDHGFEGVQNLGWAVAYHGASDTNYVSSVTDPVTPGTWYFVAGTWDGARLTLYLNGVAVASNPYAEPPDASPYGGGSPPMLGKNTCCAQYLDGALDDVRIYSRALDSNEMSALYVRP